MRAKDMPTKGQRLWTLKSSSFESKFACSLLLLLKSVSSVVKLVVGAAISVGSKENKKRKERRKVSSLVPSHLFSPSPSTKRPSLGHMKLF